MSLAGAVALDVDGVLIDSLAVHRRVWSEWARERGLDVELVWQATFGRRPEDTVAAVGPGLDPRVERRALDRLLDQHEADVAVIPGAGALLERLDGTPWAVVTSGNREVTEARFRRLGLPLPRVGVFGEDVERGKPDPESYLQASRLLGRPPSACVVVEDAPAGIVAGRAAGCVVFAVATTHPPAALGEADEIHEGLPAVAARLGELLGLRL